MTAFAVSLSLQWWVPGEDQDTPQPVIAEVQRSSAGDILGFTGFLSSVSLLISIWLLKVRK